MTSAHPILADLTPAVVGSTATPFASACRSTRVSHRRFRASCPPIPANHRPAARTPSARCSAMDSRSAPACPDMWRARTPFAAAWNRSTPATPTRAEPEPFAIHPVNQSATVRTTRLAIHSGCAKSPLFRLNSASPVPVDAMPTAMWPVIARSATADPDILETPTKGVANRVALSAIQTPADPMPTVWSMAMARLPVSARTDCQEIPPRSSAAMAMSAKSMPIVRTTRPAWASAATIPAPEPAAVEPVAVSRNTTRCALAMLA